MKALTFIQLGDKRFAPGDEITDEELKEAGQTEEQVKELVDAGSLGDADAELHEDHRPVEAPAGTITASDGGSGDVG
jgi:hypothetical protein